MNVYTVSFTFLRRIYHDHLSSKKRQSIKKTYRSMKNQLQGRNGHGMKRVCMIVRNAVTQDARVIKEARSVAEAGYEVVVVGLREKESDQPEESMAEGFRIIRVPFFVYAKRVRLLRIALVAVFVACTLFWLFGQQAGTQLQSTVFRAIALVILIIVALAYWKRRIQRTEDPSDRRSDDGHQGTDKSAFHRQAVRRGGISVRSPLRIVKAAINTFKTLIGVTLTSRTMLKELARIHPDIVHCHDIGTLRLGITAKRRIGCKLVYDAHEIYDEAVGINRFMRRLNRFIHRRAQTKVDRFITISDSIAQYYSENYPLLPKAVVVMNATRLTETSEYDGRLHYTAGLPEEQKILLFQGGFTAKRGISVIAESTIYLPDNWSVVFMGSGNLEGLIRQYADEVNKKGDVKRLIVIPPAPQEELAAWTAGATIGVIPYEDHGLNHKLCTPNKLWEFPNAGVPTLVTPRVEMKRMIEKYKYGWVLKEPVSARDMGEFIKSLTESELQRARFACRHFLSECNWGVFEQNLLTLYEDLSQEVS